MAFRFLKKALSLALFLVMAGVVILPFALAQNTRLVPKRDVPVFENVEVAKFILSKFNPRKMDPAVETRVNVSADDLKGAIGVALARIVPNASVDIQARTDGVRVAGTAELPSPLSALGKYLNVEVVVVPSDTGLGFSRVAIGSIAVPVWIVRPSTVLLVDWLVGSGKGTLAYDSVRSIRVDGSRITFVFKPAAGLYDEFKVAARKMLHHDNLPAIRAYYNAIVDVSRRHRGEKAVSFAEYLSSCARFAITRSDHGDAIEENRAFILALALYFGDSRFNLLLGEVMSGAAADDWFQRDVVKLSGRHDWVQHFVTSAALQVAAGGDISNFIGEAKEIVDTEGPSGFSFTDIAADRTGVQFAEAATGSNSTARALQALLNVKMSERRFFPEVRDLPEGLTKAQFKLNFQDVGSAKYNSAIALIDSRIRSLAAYKN